MTTPIPPTDSGVCASQNDKPVRSKAMRGHWRSKIALLFQILGVVFSLMILAGVIGFAGFFMWIRQSPSPGHAESLRIELRKGDSVRTIARRLKKANVIDSESLFLAMVVWRRADRRLCAGNYEFAPGLTPKQVLALLIKGPETPLVKVTLPEGWTFSRMARRLAEKGAIVSAERFEMLCHDADFVTSLSLPDNQAEGYLFPDTYEIAQPTDEGDLIRHLVRRQEEVIRSLGLRPGINSPNAAPLDFRQSVILASIIEREAADPLEMPLISSVFHNRLKIHMKLDSCATVRYALRQWNTPLTLNDLKYNSPYNTYTHAGLPPTAICNPGRAALEAAFRPPQSDFLYFVYRGDRHHEFSRTLREHNAARARYKDAWTSSARDKTNDSSVFSPSSQ